MEGILIYVFVIVGVVSLFVFRNSFIKTHNRSCMHLSHVIIMLLYVLSMGITSNMTSFFGILCWLALAAVFVYYVKQYGLLAAIGVWLYNTLMFVLVVGAILQLIDSRKKR